MYIHQDFYGQNKINNTNNNWKSYYDYNNSKVIIIIIRFSVILFLLIISNVYKDMKIFNVITILVILFHLWSYRKKSLRTINILIITKRYSKMLLSVFEVN